MWNTSKHSLKPVIRWGLACLLLLSFVGCQAMMKGKAKKDAYSHDRFSCGEAQPPRIR